MGRFSSNATYFCDNGSHTILIKRIFAGRKTQGTDDGGLNAMNIKSEIRKYIIENFLYGNDDNTLNDDVSFLENGIIDSTGVLELVSFVQETFGIKVKDDELIPNNFDSLGKLEAFIINKQQIRDQTRVDTAQTAASPVS